MKSFVLAAFAAVALCFSASTSEAVKVFRVDPPAHTGQPGGVEFRPGDGYASYMHARLTSRTDPTFRYVGRDSKGRVVQRISADFQNGALDVTAAHWEPPVSEPVVGSDQRATPTGGPGGHWWWVWPLLIGATLLGLGFALARLFLKPEKGEKGDKGDPGPPGSRGKPGKPAQPPAPPKKDGKKIAAAPGTAPESAGALATKA